jgi:hypothetical protein
MFMSSNVAPGKEYSEEEMKAIDAVKDQVKLAKHRTKEIRVMLEQSEKVEAQIVQSAETKYPGIDFKSLPADWELTEEE